MNLTILTPKKIFTKNLEVFEVSIPAETGELTLKKGHAPIVAALKPGVLSYKEGENTESRKQIFVYEGYAECCGEHMAIFVSNLELLEEINLEEAKVDEKNILDQLNSKSVAFIDIEKIQKKLAEIRARIGAL